MAIYGIINKFNTSKVLLLIIDGQYSQKLHETLDMVITSQEICLLLSKYRDLEKKNKTNNVSNY